MEIQVTHLMNPYANVERANPCEFNEVIVVDRDAMATNWGRGLFSVITRNVVVPWICPSCGGPRGEIHGKNFYEDGETYFVNTWDNACGHVDKYRDILAEAKECEELIGSLMFPAV